MKRTTIMIPGGLKDRVERKARQEQRSFGEVVRESLARYLRSDDAGSHDDPLLSDDAVFEGPVPEDLAAGHDRYLYDEPDES